MRRPRRRALLRAAARAAAAAAAAGLVLAAACPTAAVRALDSAEGARWRRLSRALAGRHGLLFLAPLDDGPLRDLAGGRPVGGAGVVAARGACGGARRFPAGGGARSIRTGLHWNEIPADGGALMLWADLPPGGPAVERRLLWSRVAGASAGLRLLPDRTLEATFEDADGRHALAAPFPSGGGFVPVAFSFGGGRAALWIGGREAAAAPVSGALRLPHEEIVVGPSRFHPVMGAVDEVSVWNRPLSASELERLSAPGRSLASRLEPWRSLRAAAAAALARGFRTAVRVVDRVVPSRSGPAALRADVPALELLVSKKDERHFLAAHEESLRAGLRTKKAARGRAVRVRWRGADFAASLSLDDAYGAAGPARRPSFLVRAAPGALAPGSGLARLVPPERFSALHPDAPDALPRAETFFVRLFSGGSFRGVYVLEPFDAAGGGWRLQGERDPERPDRLLFGSLPAAASPAGAGLLPPEETEAARRRTLALLRSDPHFPWSAAELRLRRARHAARREALAFAPPALSALDLMGNNPSPFYVTNEIDLSAAGTGVSWRSSDPATLDVDGTVRPACCEGDLPRTVDLTGTFPDGSERTFRFRVMPEKPRLPALFLSVPDPVRKDRRTDFAAVRIPARGGAPERVEGTASGGGGLRHRGNRSYVRGARRSLSLAFDRPVAWAGLPEPASHLLLLSGYADPTRLRNALCLDAFAAMDERATPPAVSWTEVFVGGEWAGVWEAAPRPEDAVAGWAEPVFKVATPKLLWNEATADMFSREDRPGAGAGDAFAAALDLARFAAGADDAAFAAGAADVFDAGNLAAFLLFLDFAGDFDGRTHNQFLVRRRSDGRWLHLPWDCDKTFLDDRFRFKRASNGLFDRCVALLPGFRAAAARRWKALRAGPLSDAALAGWIGEKAAFLAPFMAGEYALVPPAGSAGSFAADVERLRGEVLFRARQLDRWTDEDAAAGD
ncbi:MAG: CotH kinase family protein [Kiritimatiellae bacterium]|nr:CotH kinase family protein [Kiritimatiellia bacterium]